MRRVERHLQSRPLPLANHALIYAGAQKNLGPSGISLVIARQELRRDRRDATCRRSTQYRVYVEGALDAQHAEHVRHLDDRRGRAAWIRAQGGLAAMAERNARKAKLLYDFLDD